jgi:hypothetical protein
MKKPLLLFPLVAILGLVACDRDNRTDNTRSDNSLPHRATTPTPGPSSTPGQPGVAGDAGDLGTTGGSGSLGRPPPGSTSPPAPIPGTGTTGSGTSQ